jgi:hypothetical protein
MNTVKQENITLTGCVDCLMIVANDDASGMDAETEATVRAGINDWAIEGYVLVPGDDEDHFSRARCEVCGTHLAGGRHEIVAIPR